MECNVKAYNGQDSYLFLDFCDEDSLRVYPLIERLTMEGVRVWYRTDESIEETMTKFESCKACLFAVSSKSARRSERVSECFSSGLAKGCFSGGTICMDRSVTIFGCGKRRCFDSCYSLSYSA